MKISLLILCSLFLSPTLLFAEDTETIEIGIQLGASFFTGTFREHLIRDGAYAIGPITQLDLSLPLIAGLGLRASLASGAVIHPRSEPIEGTFLLHGLGPVYNIKFDDWGFYLNTAIGIQHTTLLLNYYAAGYLEAGLGAWVQLKTKLALQLSLSYRHGILPSLLIAQHYGLETGDQIQAINLGLGLVWN